MVDPSASEIQIFNVSLYKGGADSKAVVTETSVVCDINNTNKNKNRNTRQLEIIFSAGRIRARNKF